jgi:Helicase associated domain
MALGRLSISITPVCQRARHPRPWFSIEFFRLNTQQFLSTAAATHSLLDGDDTSSQSFRGYQEERWDRNFREVHDKLSSGAAITEPYLKSWILRQRREYNQRLQGSSETRLHDTRLKKLLPLDEKFHILQTERNSWDKRFKELLEFIKNSDGLFPYEVDEEDLGPTGDVLLEWCCRQRNIYHKQEKGQTKGHRFSAERKKKLDDIGFAWALSDVRWTHWYEELVDYYTKYGNSMVPNYYRPNKGKIQ